MVPQMTSETLNYVAAYAKEKGVWTGMLSGGDVEELECRGMTVHVLPKQGNLDLRRCTVSPAIIDS